MADNSGCTTVPRSAVEAGVAVNQGAAGASVSVPQPTVDTKVANETTDAGVVATAVQEQASVASRAEGASREHEATLPTKHNETTAEAEEASLDAEVRAALASSNGRLSSLNRLFAGVLDSGLPVLPEQVVSHFSSVPEPYHPVLVELQEQICGQIREACMAEFKEIVEDTHTDVLLNECDLDSEHKLSLLAQHVEPTRVVSSARLKVKQEEAAALKSMLHEIQQQQTELEAELKGKQEGVMGLAQKFEPISDRLQQVEHAARQWQAALKENRVP